jgi:phosphoribosylformimino-5-aminoimidazole carboxamide ribotide isomerase
MELIPAIDLLEGRCVRLFQGDFDQCQLYDRAPEEIAAEYAAAGAQWLHVVDLAASRDGSEADTEPLFDFLGSARQKIQTGGGVRQASDIKARLEAGASRVVVGSITAEDPFRFARWISRFGPECLVAALDVRMDGVVGAHVRLHGWTQDSGKSLWDVVEYLAGHGLRHVLCTDISRDGAMSGPNVSLYEAMQRRFPEIHTQASGGIRDVDDLKSLAATGVAAAISGKALLDGRFTVAEAIEALETDS